MTTAISTDVRPLVISSLEIAKEAGKPHCDLMKAIRNMESSWVKLGEGNFSLAEYQDAQGKPRPCYLLTKEQTLFIITKFNDETRAKLILRWKKLEEEQQAQIQAAVPTSFSQALLLAAKQQQEIEEQQKLLAAKTEQVNMLTDKIEEMRDKVSYLDEILQSKATVIVTQIAQDYGMSARNFNKLLEQHGIQRKIHGQWVLHAKYLAEGYVHSHSVIITHTDGHQSVKLNTEWTQRGRVFLYEFLKGKNILPLIES